ncbi:MAG: DNA internalization-related competence protein ComEC/Rec2 [Nevskiaceae bacterium]|nr:MAG: DNA internalization-related competence protein ComEC/Rec2 [Nevskiaceae bacterium]TBR73656.1 MAG: DNA internalization-related competence protein ComEC/Rec2 [Nevskiaceae bacterium]
MPPPAERAAPSAADAPLFLCLAVTAGVIVLLALPEIPGAPWLLAAALPGLVPWRGRRWLAPLCLGFLVTAWNAGDRIDDRWPVARDGEVVTLTGAVADLPQARGAGRSASVRFLFEPQGNTAPALPRRIRVAWYDGHAVVRGGECWQLALKLRAPHGSASPGAFDYERWLFMSGIGATGVVKTGTPCGAAPGYTWLRLRAGLRDRLDGWLHGVPGHGLVDGLVLGDRARLVQHDWDTFRETGTSHLMAVSGLHLGIVAGAAYFLLRWLWVLWPGLALRLPAQKAALVGSVAVGVLYAALSGFAVPALRSAIMLAVAAFALLLGGARSLPRALALAWLIIVLADPTVLLGASLWLSFGAVALIAWWVGGRLGLGGKLKTAVQLQVALSIALVPLTLWFFGGASWVSPLANLCVIPAAGVLLPLLMVAVVLALAVPAVGIPALQAMSWAWWALYRGLEWLATSAPHVWLALVPHPLVLLLALLGAVLLLAPRGLPVRPLAFACLLPLVLPRDLAPPPGHFRLAVLDVGEGLAAVVRTHRHALLFDAGPAFPSGLNMGEAVVVPYLRTQGLRGLDVMMISHRDMDHRGGAPAVQAALPVVRMLGVVGENPCFAGQRWEWDGVVFDVLNPSPDVQASRNNSGCVLRVAVQDVAVLLPADIEARAEAWLVEAYGAELRAPVLVAPHHGSRTSSTPAFVAAVRPEVVIYPAGWENQFHFPRPEVVARYTAARAGQFQTGVLGTLEVDVGPEGPGPVRAWRSERRRLWHAAVQ